MKLTLEKVLLFFIVAFLLVLPGFPQFAAIGMGFSLLFSFIISLKNKSKFELNQNLILLGSFYVLHLIGMLYTNNINYALLDIQIKASFLLVPLCFNRTNFKQNEVSLIKAALVVGCLIYSLFLIIRSFINYQLNHQLGNFFYTEFCPYQHVAYLTMYIVLACIFIFQHLIENRNYSKLNKIASYLLMLFFYIIISMLSSRTAIFAALVSFTLFLFFSLRPKLGYIKSLLYSIGNAIIFCALFCGITGSENRFEKPIPTENIVTVEQKSVEKSSTMKHNVRYTLWSTAFEIFKEQPLLGVGTGDIKDELLLKYKQQNFEEGITYNLNVHNQIFQTLATLGIPGFSSIFLLFLIPIALSIKKANITFLAFIAMIIINCLTESVFEKQAGVLFFCFFFFLLQQPKFYSLNK